MWKRFEDRPILIAEDSDDDLLLLQRALRKAGIHNLQTVTSTGRETVLHLERALVAEENFPVILFLDLLMPRANGMEVLEWLRDHVHPPVSVVLHTGVEDEVLLQ